MSDFAHAVKYLDKTVSRKATLAEAEARQFDKYYSLLNTRAIQKLHYFLTLPTKSYTYVQIQASQWPRMLFQYNVQLPSASYILSVANPLDNLRSGMLTVKWRVGTTVTRYKLGRSFGLPNPEGRFSATKYANQQLPQYVVFEFWYTGTNAMFQYSAGVRNAIEIKIAALANPANADETRKTVSVAAALDIPTLGFAVPFESGQVQPLVVYTSN